MSNVMRSAYPGPVCQSCNRYELETQTELDAGICEGCLIDLWEEQQRRREQRWLEDDRNWPEDLEQEQ